MGCDIHMAVEVRKEWDNIKKWLNVDHFQLSIHDQFDGGILYETIDVYHDRNYTLFAMLANVRNYYDVTPMAEPKGVPEDIAWITKRRIEEYGTDGHSHSWFTLKELKEYASKKLPITYKGYVYPEEVIKIDAGEMPSMWCQGTNDKNMVWKEWNWIPNDMDELIEAIQNRKNKVFWIWENESTNTFHDDDIRIIFWFDN